MRQPCLVSTDVHHYNDGTTSRDQMISAPTVAEVLKLYRAIAQIDANIVVGEELANLSGADQA